MGIFDWIIIGILGVSVLISIRRGFVKEALSLATWVVAVVITRLFALQLSVLLEDQIPSNSLRLAASCFILFVGTLVVGGIVNFVVGEFVKITGLSSSDRILGIFFGLARGILIVFLMVASIHYFAPIKKSDWYQHSKLVPEIVPLIEIFGPVLWAHGEYFFQEAQEQKETGNKS